MIKEETAVFAGGCFWCTEAQFQRIKGVTKVISGYTGGSVANPTYQQVCTGKTGHYEAIKIDYQPQIITYEKLLEVFFASHNPSEVNEQGALIKSQYRSCIFYFDQHQRDLARAKIKELQSEQGMKIDTRLMIFQTFYPAQIKHQNYYNLKGKNNSYGKTIQSKLQKLKQQLKDYYHQ